MTLSEVYLYLEKASKKAGAASFWYGKEAQQNINYAAPFPQALLFLVPSKLTERGIEHQIAMCFIGNDQHENGTIDSVAITDAMDVLTQKFFYDVLMEDDAITVERMERSPVLRKGAGVGTGYLITFTLITPRVGC